MCFRSGEGCVLIGYEITLKPRLFLSRQLILVCDWSEGKLGYDYWLEADVNQSESCVDENYGKKMSRCKWLIILVFSLFVLKQTSLLTMYNVLLL